MRRKQKKKHEKSHLTQRCFKEKERGQQKGNEKQKAQGGGKCRGFSHGEHLHGKQERHALSVDALTQLCYVFIFRDFSKTNSCNTLLLLVLLNCDSVVTVRLIPRPTQL